MHARPRKLPSRRASASRKAFTAATLIVLCAMGLLYAFTSSSEDQLLSENDRNKVLPSDVGALSDREDGGEVHSSESDRGLPLGVQPWDAAARPYLNFTLVDDAALPARALAQGPVITHAEFLRCLAHRLAVEVSTRSQRGLEAATTTPMVVFPLMAELSDHRQLMCNMTTNIRYLMYVDNGGLSVMGRFLDDVLTVFGWTGRVAVRRYPWNAGLSAAINSAMHWAMTKSSAEVPFLQVSNNDVRYPPGMYEQRLTDMYELTQSAGDAAREEELQREVATERYQPDVAARYRLAKPMREPWTVNATLVTSLLLPDSIRYMPYETRKKQFTRHTSLMFFQHQPDFSTFFLSRLGMLTIGYWDENYYPYGLEGVDYRWRSELLRFLSNVVEEGGMTAVHYESGVRKLQQPSQLVLDPLVEAPSSHTTTAGSTRSVQDAVATSTDTHLTHSSGSSPDVPHPLSQREASLAEVAAAAATTEADKDAVSTFHALSAEVTTLLRDLDFMLSHHRAADYAATKWGTADPSADIGVDRYPEPFSSSAYRLVKQEAENTAKAHSLSHEICKRTHNNYLYLPLDVTVRDPTFQAGIRKSPRELARIKRIKGYVSITFDRRMWLDYFADGTLQPV